MQTLHFANNWQPPRILKPRPLHNDEDDAHDLEMRAEMDDAEAVAQYQQELADARKRREMLERPRGVVVRF